MKGDFTRLTFDPKKHYRGVLMQQGRVQLDADWNEQVQIAEHRYSTFFGDFVGQSGAPAGNALCVEYDAQKKQFVVRPGRYYVAGILVENEQDLCLTLPLGIHVLYLDVWTRQITAAEDRELREPALGGADTTTRLKTEWQVRYCAPPAGTTSLDQLTLTEYGANWRPRPATGTGAMEVKLAPESGFDQDNRLYRVEIFKSSPQPTFVWSADNGATAARVLLPTAATQLGDRIELDETAERVASLFPPGTVLEMADEASALNCEPGLIATVSAGDEHWLNVTWQDAARANARVWQPPVIARRWEELPANVSSTWAPLGNSGLQIRFERSQSLEYCTGDYWQIPMRSGMALNWDKKPSQTPHGVDHHYAALAAVNVTDQTISLKPLGVVFEALTSEDLVEAGNLCVRGMLGVGLPEPGLLHAPLNVQRAPTGELIEFQSGDQAHWRIGEVENTLSITGTKGGLYLQSEGSVGIGTASPQQQLSIQGISLPAFGGLPATRFPGSLSLELKGIPSKGDRFGALYFGSNNNRGLAQYPVCILGVSESAVNKDHPQASGQLHFQTLAPPDDIADSEPTTKMVITGAGDVGIGTDIPKAKLHIDPQGKGGMIIGHWPGEPGGFTSLSLMISKETDGYSSIQSVKSSGTFWGDLSLNPYGGNVGIGEQKPTQRLMLGSGNILLPNAKHETDGNLYFGGRTDIGEVGMRLFGGKVNQNEQGGNIHAGFVDVMTGDAKDGLRFRVDTIDGSKERMRITADGYVGIGTPSPDSPLTIQGDGGMAARFMSFKGPSKKTVWAIDYSQGALMFTEYDNNDKYYERVIFAPNGNVGIGKPQPWGLLHLKAPNGIAPLVVEGINLYMREVKDTLTNAPNNTIVIGVLDEQNPPSVQFAFKGPDGKIYLTEIKSRAV